MWYFLGSQTFCTNDYYLPLRQDAAICGIPANKALNIVANIKMSRHYDLKNRP